MIGEFTHADVHVELRKAIEPWYVLGEEPAGGGTARYVDSSRRAAAGESRRHDRPAARRHLQRPQTAAASDGRRGRICRRRALSGLAAAELSAPDDPGRRAAGVRRARPVDEPLAGRLHVPRRPPGRAESRARFRSTRSRPRAAARPGSSGWATTAARWRRRPTNRIPTSR